MKKIKKLLIAVTMLVFVLPAWESCRKGEEDPALTLRSRDKRMQGTWNLTGIELSRITTESMATEGGTLTRISTQTDFFDGERLESTLRVEESGPGAEEDFVSITVSDYSLRNTVEDNTVRWESVESVTHGCFAVNGTSCTPVILADPSVTVINDKDEWYWADSKKNKIAIFSSAPFFSGNMVRLANKELIFDGEWETEESTIATGFEDSQTITGTFRYIFEKE